VSGKSRGGGGKRRKGDGGRGVSFSGLLNALDGVRS